MPDARIEAILDWLATEMLDAQTQSQAIWRACRSGSRRWRAIMNSPSSIMH
jgi:hypothetical protein